MRSEAFTQFNRGWTDYDSSTGTENDYKTKITGFTSNGFIYNNFYNVRELIILNYCCYS